MGLSVAAMLFLRHRHFELTERAMQWPDALGLGLFAATGVSQAQQAGTPTLVAVLMGVVTTLLSPILLNIAMPDDARKAYAQLRHDQ